MDNSTFDPGKLPEPFKSMIQNMDPQALQQMLAMLDPETLSSLMNSTFGMIKNQLPQEQEQAMSQLLESIIKLMSSK